LRQFLTTLTAMTIWQVLFVSQATGAQLFGFTQAAMTGYIFLAALLQSTILATSLNGLAQDIYSGQMSNLFVQPIRPLGVLIARECADKLLNLVFTVVECGILLLIFRPALPVPTLGQGLLFALSVVMGAVLLFHIMLLFGCVGFWSQETWGPRFLFFMFLEFTAGKLFPLSVLPKLIQDIMSWTPFPYLTYVQSQIYLGHLSGDAVVRALVTMLAWIVGLGLLYRSIWQKGLREYGALGH
jgi:ABC-2 type transport system permease protein